MPTMVNIKNMKIVAGIDIGSTTTKTVIMRGNTILGSKISSTGANCKKTVKLLLDEMLEDLDLKEGEIQYTVTTGYGRRMVPRQQNCHRNHGKCQGRQMDYERKGKCKDTY